MPCNQSSNTIHSKMHNKQSNKCELKGIGLMNQGQRSNKDSISRSVTIVANSISLEKLEFLITQFYLTHYYGIWRRISLANPPQMRLTSLTDQNSLLSHLYRPPLAITKWFGVGSQLAYSRYSYKMTNLGRFSNVKTNAQGLQLNLTCWTTHYSNSTTQPHTCIQLRALRRNLQVLN